MKVKNATTLIEQNKTKSGPNKTAGVYETLFKCVRKSAGKFHTARQKHSKSKQLLNCWLVGKMKHIEYQ